MEISLDGRAEMNKHRFIRKTYWTIYQVLSTSTLQPKDLLTVAVHQFSCLKQRQDNRACQATLTVYHRWKHELGEWEDHWFLTAIRAFWDTLSRGAISMNSLCFSEVGLPTTALLLGSYRSLRQHLTLLPHSLARFAAIPTSLDCLFRKHSLAFSLCAKKRAPEVYSAFEMGTSSPLTRGSSASSPCVLQR